MQDFLQDLIDENDLSMGNVHKALDDYSIYCYYIGMEPELHEKYSSPLREGDEDPSFSLFEGYGDADPERIYFKDHASIGSGDVFRFVSILLSGDYKSPLKLSDTLKQINHDFGLGLGGNEEHIPFEPKRFKKVAIKKERKQIKIIAKTEFSAEFLEFWKRYDISLKTLEKYCVQEVDYIVYVGEGGSRKIIKPKNLCISYRIGEFYKLYQPYDKDNKFRNNLPAGYAEGFVQIDWSRNDFFIITKATKECTLFDEHWNIQSGAGKSENTMIPPFLMEKLRTHFKRVYIWLDPDGPGLDAQEKYLEMYPWLWNCIVPDEIVEKDPTDFYEIHRLEATTNLINTVLQNAKQICTTN